MGNQKSQLEAAVAAVGSALKERNEAAVAVDRAIELLGQVKIYKANPVALYDSIQEQLNIAQAALGYGSK